LRERRGLGTGEGLSLIEFPLLPSWNDFTREMPISKAKRLYNVEELKSIAEEILERMF
jgi:hypothetical protein